MPAAVTLADVEAAAARIARSLPGRPPAFAGAVATHRREIFVKFENFQLTASFKERGALNFLLQLDNRNAAVA